MRNNVSEPGVGHVIMFAAATAGWTVLFVISLLAFAPGPAWWVRVVFSGLLMIASGVFTLLLWHRLPRGATKRGGPAKG